MINRSETAGPTTLLADLAAATLLTCMALLVTALLANQPRMLDRSADQIEGIQALFAPARLDHFYGAEGTDQRYRWSDGRGLLILPNPGGPILVRLHLAAGPGEAIPLQLTSLNSEQRLQLTPELRQYQILIPSQAAPLIELRLLSAHRQIADDTRKLGIVLGNVQISGGGSMPGIVLLLIGFASAGCYAGLRVARLPTGQATLLCMLILGITITWLMQVGWANPGLLIALLVSTTLIGLAGLVWCGFSQLVRSSNLRLQRMALFTLTGITLVPLICYSIVGSFTRYIADDYCYAAIEQTQGPFRLVATMYTTWSGRYSSTLLIGILSQIGTFSPPLMPAIMLISALAALWWMLTEYGRLLGFHDSATVAGLLAAPILTATVAGAPNQFQSIYWQIGNQTYFAPLIVMLLFGAWAARAIRTTSHPLSSGLVGGVFGIIAAGFSETNAVLHVAIFACAGLGVLLLVRSAARPTALALLAGATIGALVGLALVAGAPGNRIRQAFFQAPPALLGVVWLSIQETLIVLSRPLSLLGSLPSERWLQSPLLIGRPLALAMASFATFLIGIVATRLAGSRTPLSWKHAGIALVLIPLLTALLILVCLLPGFYTFNARPPDRVFLAPALIAALGTAACGCVIGRTIGGAVPAPTTAFLATCAVLALGLSIVGALGDARERAPRMATYARTWAEFDQTARQAATSGRTTLSTTATLAQLDGLEGITTNPGYWSNGCVAQYYQLDQIQSTP